MSELKKNLKTFRKERIRRLNAIKRVDKKAKKEWLNLVKKKIFSPQYQKKKIYSWYQY